MEKIKAGVIGVSFPFGMEIVRNILSHPMCELTAVSSSYCRATTLNELFPAFSGHRDLPIVSDEQVIESADIVFNTDPRLHSTELAAACVNEKSVLIDLNDDLRFKDPEQFYQWCFIKYSDPGYPAIYNAALRCIPEFNRVQLPGKVIVSCPSAVAEAAVIALAPALSGGLICPDNIVISVCLPSKACEAYNSGDGYNKHGTVRAYMMRDFVCGEHLWDGYYEIRELSATGEIENFLSETAGTDVHVTLLPFAVPVDRGMVISCQAKTTAAGNEQNLRAAYEKMYASEHFIRLMPNDELCSSEHTAYTNYCDLSLNYIERTGSFVVSCAMDYFMKGSAGNAVQIMNAMFNMPEHTGLEPSVSMRS